jgi:hypothetical protein
VGRTEGKTPLGRCKHRWEDNIKMGLKEIWFEGVDGIQVVQAIQLRPLVVMDLRVP